MTKLKMASGLLLLAAVGACDSSLLDLRPQDEISEDIAIVDEASAQAALLGAYGALQSGSLYGGDMVLWTDLLTDDVEHTGTFGSYGTADLLALTADNGVVEGVWNDSYEGINRVNVLIQAIPELSEFDQAEADRMVGEARALRALYYFGLVRAYGDVPLVLVPPASLEEASQVSRDPVAEVYGAIEADLTAAATLMTSGGVDNNDDRTFVTPGFADALRAQVHLTQGEWAEAEAAAMEVVNSTDYSLAPTYAELFTDDGGATPEDIFRVEFISTDANNFGYYYQYAGRFEIGATQEMFDLFDQTNDERFAVMFDGTRPDGIQVVKYPTTAGTENFHVIRYAEVLLILAEALAQQGGAQDLIDGAGYLNDVRTRSGLTAYAAADVDTQQELLDAIYMERRIELAFEGERWFDLVRTGRVVAEMGEGLPNVDNLWPVPVSELDVAPNLIQNGGYEQ